MWNERSRVFLEADKLIVNSRLSNKDQNLLIELTLFCSGIVFPKQYKCNSACLHLTYKSLEVLEKKLAKRNKEKLKSKGR